MSRYIYVNSSPAAYSGENILILFGLETKLCTLIMYICKFFSGCIESYGPVVFFFFSFFCFFFFLCLVILFEFDIIICNLTPGFIKFNLVQRLKLKTPVIK